MNVKKIGVAKFKQHCLAILDELGSDGVVVTKHGEAVALVLPVKNTHAELIGSLKDVIRVNGDIMSTGESWDATSKS